MNAIRNALKTVSEWRQAYIFLNLGYFGLVVAGMVYAAFNRSAQLSLLQGVESAFEAGPIAIVMSAYTGGRIPLAISLTFLVNLAIGSFLSITLPSLVIPFSGLLIGFFRAVLWGVLFSPTNLELSPPIILAGVLIVVLIFLEGQAYVLAMLAAFVQGFAFLFPKRVSAESHGRGFLIGVGRSALIYLLVAIVLAIAAVYEVLIAVLILPRIV
ncbi:MAG: hypothetical protein PVJ32_05730 [Anaerolineales bacterium]|jgi:hypothetical protein